MQIIELVLHLYKRTVLAGIETLRYTPGTETQIILGSNGSGKSSVMDELTPFPPDKDSMHPGGYKIFRATRDGKEFLLRSDYTGRGAGKHSFIVIEDGVETSLNENGTASAQKTLIERYFGITQDIMDIWIGRTTFTDMPPTKRRDWIIKLNGSDLNYAMNIYKRIRTGERDAVGVVKHYAKRLAEETTDMADQNRINELEKRVNFITEELNTYLTQKEPNIPSTDVIRLELGKLKRQFDEHTSEILTLRLVKPLCLKDVKNDIHLVDGFISGHEARLNAEERRLDSLYQEKGRIIETIQLLESSGVEKIEELGKAIQTEEKELDKMIKGNALYNQIKDVNIGEMIGAFKGCKGVLVDVLSNLYDNSDRYYTNEQVKIQKETALTLSRRMKQGEEMIVRLRHNLEHLQNTEMLSCPQCEHKFIPGFTQTNPVQVKQQLDVAVKTLGDLEIQYKAAETYVTGATEYAAQIRTVKRLISDNPILQPLWDILHTEGLFKVAPIVHFPTIDNFFNQLEECHQLKAMYDALVTNQTLYRNLSSTKTDTSSLTGKHIEDLERNINATIDCIEIYKRELTEVRKFSQEVKKAQKANNEIQLIMKRMEDRFETLMKSIRNSALGKVIHEKQIDLAMTNNTLNTLSKHEALLGELQREKSAAEEHALAYKALENVVSPTTGIIAKYIQNSIDVFTSDVNSLVDEVWTYPLEILGCGIDTTEVNCKFPLSINDGYLVVDDISRGSFGQRDIINLMFKLVFGMYLGLQGFPLYLDELAPTLDEQHRQNLIRFINNLMESGKFNQMFMISHYSANHFAFVNAQFLLLDGRNIQTLPPVYNDHAEITYRNYTEEMVS